MSLWHSAEPGTEQFAGIQVLRALAAVAVIWAHVPVEITYGLKWGTPVPMSLTIGAAADLFFVISGFVIVYASEPLFGKADAPRVFLLRRFARILPLSWLTSVFILAVVLLTYPNLAAAFHSVGSVIGSFAMIPYMREGVIPFPLNPPAWTMPYEMFFYVIFTPAILLSRTRAVAAVIALFVALVILGRAMALPQPLAGWFDPLLLDFCYGMLIALAYRAGVRIPRAVQYALVLAALLAYAASVVWGPFIQWRVLEWGVPGAFIVAAFTLGSKPAAPPLPGFILSALVLVGNASYSILLLHYPILSLPRRIIGRFMTIPYMPWTLAFLLVGFAIVLGVAAHLLFERPFTRLLYRWIGDVRGAEKRVGLRAAE